MDISIGTGLTVFSFCATFLGVFYKVFPKNNNGNSFCKDHIGMATDMATVKKGVQNIESVVGELKQGQANIHSRVDEFINKFVEVKE